MQAYNLIDLSKFTLILGKIKLNANERDNIILYKH